MKLTEERKRALIEKVDAKWETKKEYGKKNFGMDMSLSELALVSAAEVNGQQYGPKLANWIMNKFNWKSMASTLGKGDSKTPNGVVVEQKWSIRDDKFGAMQARFDQPIDYYLFGHIDPHSFRDESKPPYDIFLMTHDQAEEECKLLKGRPTHGTDSVNQINQITEWSFGPNVGSDDHQRWKDKYKVDFDVLSKL